MIYVSDQIGKPVVDVDGERVGRVQDIIASMHERFPHPQIVAIAVRQAGHEVQLLSMADVAVLLAPVVVLARKIEAVAPFEVTDGLWLARDVLDKEIIDTDVARVVRVNGLELAHIGSSFYVANVAIGGLALLRRLGLAKVAQLLASAVGRTLTTATVSWDHVELLPGVHPVRMRFAGGKAADLPAADLAEIISDLNRVESSKAVESMDVERLADTLEEVEPDFQASLVESLSDEKVADVLEEMAPDEAADLLAELPEGRSEDLLNLMQQEEAEDVRRLLTYPEDTAGGLMTTDFVAVRPNLTVEQTIAILRETVREDETIYYVYVTDEGNRLLGVFSLQKLILAKAETPVTEIMHDRIVSFKPLDSQDEVAQAVAKYNLLAVPVVDDDNRMQGIVTADDAIDGIIPTAWKKRLPRLY